MKRNYRFRYHMSRRGGPLRPPEGHTEQRECICHPERSRRIFETYLLRPYGYGEICIILEIGFTKSLKNGIICLAINISIIAKEIFFGGNSPPS